MKFTGMKFVTKKEFDQAIIVIEQAIKNGQVNYGHHDKPAMVEEVLFVAEGGENISSNRLGFISPFIAAQNRLSDLRNMLQNVKSQSKATTQIIENLESTEQQLTKLVPTLKDIS